LPATPHSFCRPRLSCVPLVLVAILLVPVAAQAQQRPVTFEDLWKVKRLGKPALSVDGK
jgi:hypothetical protein